MWQAAVRCDARGMSKSLLAFALIGSLLVTACGPNVGAASQSPTPTQVPALAVSSATARRSDIQQSLALGGDIRASEPVSVVSTSAGRITRLNVNVGSQVKAGDVLAELERDSAENAVRQARAALAAAEAKLASVQAGGRSDDVGAAEAGVAQQQAHLQNMRAGARAEDVRSAQAGLIAAQAKQAALLSGVPDDIRQAQVSAVDSDKAALAAAEASFAALGGANAAALQTAQSQAESAQAQIKAAEAQITSADAVLNSLPASAEADLQAAQGAYDQALAQLQVAQAALKQNNNPAQASIAQAEAALENARSQRAQAQAQQTALEQRAAPPCGDGVDPTGGRSPANSTACRSAKGAASAAVKAADTSVDAAQAQLDLLRRGGPPAQQTQLQASVDQAQAQVRTASARLEALRKGGVAAAREKLKADAAKLDVINRGPTDEDLQQAEAAVEQARQAVLKAEQPYTPYELQQQEQAVVQAAAQLDRARRPYTNDDLAAAQAGVDQARAQLDQALLGVRDTSVIAPVDGVIAERLVSPGAHVAPQTAIAALVPPGLQLVASVQESRLAQVAQAARVFGEVRIQPNDANNRLRAGMFAHLSIVTAAKQNALVVPAEAILSAEPGVNPVVVVIGDDSHVHRQPVQIALHNEALNEIISGLAEGQVVATSRLNDLHDGDLVAAQADTHVALNRSP